MTRTIEKTLNYSNEIITNPDLLADLEGGFLRMRLTHVCNCKCEFCGQTQWSQEMQNATLDPQILYKHCKPLYPRVNSILVTGGELTNAKEGYNFCKFLAENYPQVNVITESNGILYNEKWQNLAVENLFMQHFSLNASNSDYYAKAVWEKGGKDIYNKILENIKSLAQKWIDIKMPYFTPSVSMVVNHKNANDVYDFVKLALSLKLKCVTFYFDQREGSLRGDSFLYPDILEPTLKTLMKIERVLAKKIEVGFRLWLPLNCTQKLQAEIEKIPIKVLRQEFVELLELAKGRDVVKENALRNEARKAKGKKTLKIEEDYFPSLHNEVRTLSDGTKKEICFAPFKSFDVMADGTIILCGWSAWELNIKNYIKEDYLDWAKLLNHPNFQDMRAKALKNDFSRCMDCCPLHPKNPHLNDFMKYGVNRETP